MLANVAADAYLDRAVARAKRRNRTAACQLDGMDPRSLGGGSLLHPAGQHDHRHVSDDEDDSDTCWGGPGTAENDGVDAADDAFLLLQDVERPEFIHVH